MGKVNTASNFNVAPIIVDITLIVLMGYLSYFLRFGEWVLPPYYHLFIFSASFITGLIFVVFNSYPGADSSSREVLFYFFSRIMLAFSIFMMLLVFLKVTQLYSRLWLGGWICLSSLILFIAHAAYHQLVAALQAKGKMMSDVLIVYRTEQGYETLKNMDTAGYR
ncbi:MAG: hypothetical protein KUG81_06575, partial [Gammaproteobacteria bacterium]|nr:hypothetical protein [Gammaproteobacteria bacterium]